MSNYTLARTSRTTSDWKSVLDKKVQFNNDGHSHYPEAYKRKNMKDWKK